MEKLRYLLKDALEIDMTIDGISKLLKNNGKILDKYDIKRIP